MNNFTFFNTNKPIILFVPKPELLNVLIDISIFNILKEYFSDLDISIILPNKYTTLVIDNKNISNIYQHKYTCKFLNVLKLLSIFKKKRINYLITSFPPEQISLLAFFSSIPKNNIFYNISPQQTNNEFTFHKIITNTLSQFKINMTLNEYQSIIKEQINLLSENTKEKTKNFINSFLKTRELIAIEINANYLKEKWYQDYIQKLCEKIIITNVNIIIIGEKKAFEFSEEIMWNIIRLFPELRSNIKNIINKFEIIDTLALFNYIDFTICTSELIYFLTNTFNIPSFILLHNQKMQLKDTINYSNNLTKQNFKYIPQVSADEIFREFLKWKER